MTEPRAYETEHVMPTPAVAGWTEEKRLATFARIRAGFQRDGGTILTERRVRNPAFDEPGERTTWTLTVRWRAEARREP